MENTSRHVFGLNGITGMLIATVLLLTILAGLTYLGILAQQSVAEQPYSYTNAEQVKQSSSIEVAKETMKIKE